MARMANKAYAIDRIEGDIALCECLHSDIRIKVDVKHLPPEAKEGDIILPDGDAFILDSEKTTERQEDLTGRLNKLFEKHK